MDGVIHAVVQADDAGRRDHDVAHRHHFRLVRAVDEVPHVLVGRLRAQLFRRADLNDFPVLHDADPVPHLEGFVDVVRDEDDRLFQFPLDLQQFELHVPAHQRIQRGKRLVHQQHFGIADQRPGDADPLAHPAGEPLARLMFPAVESHHGNARFGEAFAVFAPEPFHLQAVGDVSQDVSVAHQPERLKDHRYLFAAQVQQLPAAHRLNIAPLEEDLSARRRRQSVETAYRRRFSRSRKADDHENAPPENLQADIPQSDGAPRFFVNRILVGPRRHHLGCFRAVRTIKLGHVLHPQDHVISKGCHGPVLRLHWDCPHLFRSSSPASPDRARSPGRRRSFQPRARARSRSG